MLNNVLPHPEKDTTTATCSTQAASSPINIWLVDDNRVVRTALQELLGQYEDLHCKATFHSPNSVLSTLASKPGPDVILLDIQMGEACGLDAIRPIKMLSRSTHVVMLTTFFDGDSRKRALDNGASGFLLKHYSMDNIRDSIRTAHKSPVPRLKRRQQHGQTTDSSGPKTLGRRRAKTTPFRSNESSGWLQTLLTRISNRQR